MVLGLASVCVLCLHVVLVCNKCETRWFRAAGRCLTGRWVWL